MSKSARASRSCRSSFMMVFTAVFVSGCASTSAPVTGRSQMPASIATITVENRRLTDISVSALVGGTRIRLGAVDSQSSRTFAVPRMIPIPSDIELLATARLDDENYSSLPIAVGPGDSIVFIVEHAMKFSMLLKR